MSLYQTEALAPLRPAFTIQTGLGEFTAAISPKADPDFVIGEVGSTVYSKRQTIGDYWLESLHPDTSLSEVFHLAGASDQAEVEARVSQLLERAVNSAINVGYGNTVGDVLASGAPLVYKQLFDHGYTPADLSLN